MIGDMLRGIRVVDFSWVLAGPMTTKMLGAMGAEVIKVESGLRPEYRKREGWPAVVNNNKRSSTVNIASDEGRAIVRQLIRESDVLVENFSARVLQNHGLDYESVKAINERLIYVSASGVGRAGPQKDYLAYGTLLQSYSGRVGMIGKPNARGEAMGILPAWTDPITAMWEVLAILSAIRHRSVTGAGSRVDLSMLESTVALLPEAIIRSQLGIGIAEQGGNRAPGCAPAGCFRCAGEDDWIALAVRTDSQWKSLCRVMARPELAEEPVFVSSERRLHESRALNRQVAEWLRTQDAGDAEARLLAAGISAARSRSIDSVIEEHAIARSGLFPEIGPLRTIALPWSDETGSRGHSLRAPPLGEANDYVFSELLGMTPEEISRLTAKGVIA